MNFKWFFLFAANLFFILTFVVGLPFHFTVQNVSVNSSRYQYLTPQHTLAKMIGLSYSAQANCLNDYRCVTPIDQKNFLANIPMIFEDCNHSETQMMCDNPKIKFFTKTSTLTLVGFAK